VVPGPGLEHNLLLTQVAGSDVSGSILEGSPFGSGLDVSYSTGITACGSPTA
jgi:hypothetical protein